MKRVLTAAVLVPPVLFAVFRAPLWLFSALVAAIAVLALSEYLNIVKAYGITPMPRSAYVIGLLTIFSAFASADISLPARFLWLSLFSRGWMALPCLALVFGIPVVLRRDMRMAVAASATSLFGVVYVAVPLATLVLLRHDSYYQVFLVFALFSVWAGDIAAYYTGRSLGRHKLAPVVSPNKTWEGAAASVLASISVSLLIFHFGSGIARLFSRPNISFYMPLPGAPHLSLPHLLALGVIANIAAQFGDLFESAIKRGAQIKDSGSLLPGHGGILDRIDALLFAVPAVWYYAFLTRYLEGINI
jgi:phosphatidate cytidylyltransferase